MAYLEREEDMGIKEIFDTMEYGPAPESAAEALAWLVDQGDRFGQFIKGDFTKPTNKFESRNPATGAAIRIKASKGVRVKAGTKLKGGL